MIRFLGRLARLAAWFAAGYLSARILRAAIDRYRATGELVDAGRSLEGIVRMILKLVDREYPGTRAYYVGPDDPHRPGLGRAIDAAAELAAHSPGPSPSIRLRIPEPTR
jgi:hypothetical protein